MSLRVQQLMRACGSGFVQCDDAGDCGKGETCCAESELAETTTTDYALCSPERAGRVSCSAAERCSDDDPTCARRGNVCGKPHPVDRARTCGVPSADRPRPRCGAAPCAEGMTCIATNGSRSCIPGVWTFLERSDVIECDRGRDCGEDESCFMFQADEGHHCYWTVELDASSEPALCEGAADCAVYCRLTPASVGSCYVDAEHPLGRCECFSRCATDADQPRSRDR
jgi:hypothetical protein